MRKKLMISAIVALCGGTALPAATYAHHGVNGQFDLSQTLTKKGVVTKVRFANPHSYVYFDVPEANNEVVNWRCELRSGSLLKRKGWKTSMFEVGTEIEIFGSPARTEPTTCYTESVTFSDGRTLIRYGEIGDNGEFINPEQDEAPTGDDKKTDSATATDGASIVGEWGEPIPSGPPAAYAGPAPAFVLTQAALDISGNWTSEDNPRFSCQPTNIILDYRFDQMVNKIEQTPTEVTLTYGFMDTKRTIHIDGDFPEQIEPTMAGYSVGKWTGNKLDVMTKGFSPGFLEVIGGRTERTVPYSEQMEIAETFYVDDKNELVHEYTITDPVYLAEPNSHLQKSVKMDGQYAPFNCDDLTVEEGR
ncbi:DUF6152 family protein [Granulosicoccus antarcticus]|uniref:DUF4424 domain-containing protein n=1 Tax=Granulosicoccus antarcticus IMCC3135 TaxID=1192854 RepID=A0A2Z2NRI3_9GAMM|nr:DUF6152 family protein [Granulosicoccus antarcticus]ASJ72621.1 hypothetical protein IMCC3135_12665 [Granulosicoccus antarcticus IMCC3135]